MCSVGLERLAYLLVAYGLGASASSVLGLLGLWLPRQVPLLSGAGLHLLLIISLFFWAPKPGVLQHIWILYVAAILWGVGSGLNKTGLSSEYSHGHWDGWGPVCRKEAVGRVPFVMISALRWAYARDMQWAHTAQPWGPSTWASVPMGHAINRSEHCPVGVALWRSRMRQVGRLLR